MFKFCFSEDDKAANIESTMDSEKNNLQKWKECEEIKYGNNIVLPELLEENNEYILQIELEDKFAIKHVSTEIVAEIIRKLRNDENSIFRADQKHSDLVPAEYEGGLKIWQCTYDLLTYLFQKEVNFNGKKVLDLGCGAGILGLFAYKQGAKVYFQDYNVEVLKYVTIPNTLLNNREDEDKPKDCRFYSGDWQSFIDVTSMDFDMDEKLFDCILTSETIYNCDNYIKLNEVFKRRLKKTGVVYLAAKTCYFGIGGNLQCFEDMIKADDIFAIEKIWQNGEGVQREIIALRFKAQ